MATVRMAGGEITVGNVFCIGRNYAAHAVELGNAIETEEPMVFLKPTSSVLKVGEPLRLPAWSQDVHHEAELVLLIGRDARDIGPERALSVVAGYGIGLDLTARDVQAQAKQKGHPWTKSKGFPGAACISDFVPADDVAGASRFRFSLTVNGYGPHVGRATVEDQDNLLFHNCSWEITYCRMAASPYPAYKTVRFVGLIRRVSVASGNTTYGQRS